MDRWTGEQVTALAPDASSMAAGRTLAVSGSWSATGAGARPAAVWGECRGSGSTPYRTAVDLAGPAFSCSCPSRKFPCKHALGLLLLWSAGSVPEAAAPPAWTASWLATRHERAFRAASRAARPADRPAAPGPADPEAALRRATQRHHRMTDGLAELEEWLSDQVRAGLAGTDRSGYQPFDTLAARMVDAQLPAVAATVRRLAGIAVSGEGWPGRLLQEYGLLHLLARAAPAALRRPGDDPLAATIRSHLGVNVAKDDVLTRPAVRDRWAVLGARDDLEERLAVRRVWLRGEHTARMALVLSFAIPGQALDASLVPGRVVDADLHYYPGALPLRALVGARYGPPERLAAVPGLGLEDALAVWAAALRDDPWLRSWPVVLSEVVPVVDGLGGERWWLAGPTGSLPLVSTGEHTWTVLAASGGHPVTVLAELVPGGARLVTTLASARQRELVPR